VAAPNGEVDRACLFAPPVRWGQEYVEPEQPAQSKERDSPPSQREVRLVSRPQAAGLQEAAVLATVGGVGALVLDSALGVFTGGAKGVAEVLVVFVHLAAAAVAFRIARAWQRVSFTRAPFAGAESKVLSGLLPGLNALLTLFAPYIVLPIEAVRLWRRVWRGRQDRVPHPGDAKRAEAEYDAAVAAWRERITQFETVELERFEGAACWYPVPLSQTAHMTCVFGGTPASWTAALSTLGASLLGSGARIVIGDLSRRITADVLCDLGRTAGIPTGEAVLPGDAAAAGLLEDVSWDELSTVLVEVLHSAQQDLDASRRERQDDRSVIREVAGCLDASAAVSIARLRKALLVVQGVGGTIGEQNGAGDGLIAAAERDRLGGLFNDVQRQHGRVMERVIRIERALRDLEALDGPAAQRNGAQGAAPEHASPGGEQRGDLLVIGVDKHSDDLENDRLVDILFQLLLRRVRQGWTQADVLIVLGADRIRREALESLMTHAEQRRIRVLLFFEHLRQDAIAIVGGGGAAAAFLALGNHREAREASDFIGDDEWWVESQRTATASRALTQTAGSQESTATAGTLGFPLSASIGRTKTKGRSYSEAFGAGQEYAVGEERVRRAIIAPEVLMGLPAAGMIYVEVLPGGRRIVRNVDCHPNAVLAPRVAAESRALSPAS
jgi:hypothetical protein